MKVTASRYDIKPVRTYKTFENAETAVKKFIDTFDSHEKAHLIYTILIHTNGRFFPVFLGRKAANIGVHSHNFNVIAG